MPKAMRGAFTSGVAALLIATSLISTPASAQQRRDQPPAPYSYWETHRDPPPGHEFRPRDQNTERWDDRRNPPPNWNRNEWNARQNWLRRNGHDRNDNDSSAGLIIGAILGFALGAAVVDSQQQQDYAQSRLNDPAWIAYCARRYRSFDPYTGTYFGADGLRHYCR